MKRHPLIAFIAFSLLSGCSSTSEARNLKKVTQYETLPPKISMKKEVHEKILGAMQEELERSKSRLKIDDYSLPYFIAYRLIDAEDLTISGKYGAVQKQESTRNRVAYVEVRVGDYSFDNFANIDAESYRLSEKNIDPSVPFGSNVDAIRGTFWLLTDQEYKKATSDYLTKKGGAIYETDEKKKVDSFSKDSVQVDIEKVKPLVFDAEKWKGIVERVTKKLTEHKAVVDSDMLVSARRVLRYFVSTEGAKLLESRTIYSVQINASTIADDGMPLTNNRFRYTTEEEKMPSEKELNQLVDTIVVNLEALKKAPKIDPYTGPAILMPQASGVLFHEAVGHRLEGERQRDNEEGQTFKGRVGKVVMPKFLTVYDDPTVVSAAGKTLNGTYKYDDEGVLAQRALLIDKGVLRSFLLSRTPIEGVAHSNGHGRASGINKPMARMANTFVVASPEKRMPLAELKKKLIEEVKRQGKPFGLIITDITGGSTNTSGYGYQAFKGTPQLIYKVDPETGNETLVRGAELVGTPLTSINKIIAASEEEDVFNGYCGAESGWVPVSAVAPALLTTEVELQRTQSAKERPPILSAPWQGR